MSDDYTRKRETLSPLEFVAKSGLSLATVRRYLRDGRIPSSQPGGLRCRVLIPVSALEPYAKALGPAFQASGPDQPKAVRRAVSKRSASGPKPRWRTES